MLRPITLLTVLCLPVLFGCATDAADIDDAVTEEEAGKADEVGAYRHYLLWAEPSADGTGTRWLARAGGGELRCPDDVVREACEVTAYDFVPTLGLRENPEVVFDELDDHAMIVRGRLVRTDDDRIYVRASALTRGLTSVEPTGLCYRMRPRATEGNCPSSTEPCRAYDLELLDHDTVAHPQTLSFDHVDPTPDFWGQPTPAVQAAIDAALVLAQSRPVYTCGDLYPDEDARVWTAEQVFAPRP